MKIEIDKRFIKRIIKSGFFKKKVKKYQIELNKWKIFNNQILEFIYIICDNKSKKIIKNMEHVINK